MEMTIDAAENAAEAGTRGMVEPYFKEAFAALWGATATFAGHPISLAGAVACLMDAITDPERRGPVILFGNGGSAAIANHIAVDLDKNCQTWAISLAADAVTLSANANDLGVKNMFTTQITASARWQQERMNEALVIAMSCSGRSENITRAAEVAGDRGMRVVTLSGCESHNPLKSLGMLNFHIPSRNYGFVQLAHLAILHAAVDIIAGWQPSAGDGS